mmetsp:Transcript_21629/g.62056  ORF Transcript_21629/g.62056 Transcript_21629/m.62056 type:complete len:277 (+) Transcript_21629:988-1818(+)
MQKHDPFPSLLAHDACKIVKLDYFHSRFGLRKSSFSVGDISPRAQVQLDSLQSIIVEALGQRWPSIFKEVCRIRIVPPRHHTIHDHIGLLLVHAQTINIFVGQRGFGHSRMPTERNGKTLLLGRYQHTFTIAIIHTLGNAGIKCIDVQPRVQIGGNPIVPDGTKGIDHIPVGFVVFGKPFVDQLFIVGDNVVDGHGGLSTLFLSMLLIQKHRQQDRYLPPHLDGRSNLPHLVKQPLRWVVGDGVQGLVQRSEASDGPQSRYGALIAGVADHAIKVK